MIKSDLHTHTRYSFDGSGSMEELCIGAINNGVEFLAATEHFDIFKDGLPDRHFMLHNDERKAEIELCREKFKGKLTLLSGVEIGQPFENPKLTQKLYDDNNFDIVIGSIHNLADGTDVYTMPYTDVEKSMEIMGLYLIEVLKLVKASDFDVLGHIDFPIRKMEGLFSQYTMKPYEEITREILKTLASRGKALEINTRGLRCWQKCICPELWILKAFKEYGGEYLAIGSDSHTAQFVGLGNDIAQEAIRAAGFKGFTYYKNRQAYIIEC